MKITNFINLYFYPKNSIYFLFIFSSNILPKRKKYCPVHQVKGDENQEMIEEHREEKNMEDGDDNKNIWKQEDMPKNSEQIEEASNRLNPEHKRYITYTMDFKKQIIQEVNKNNNI